MALMAVNTDSSIADAKERWLQETILQDQAYIQEYDDLLAAGSISQYDHDYAVRPDSVIYYRKPATAIVDNFFISSPGRRVDRIPPFIPNAIMPGYVGSPPFTTYFGVDQINAKLSLDSINDIWSAPLKLFKVDSNNVPVEILDELSNAWRRYSEFLNLDNTQRLTEKPIFAQSYEGETPAAAITKEEVASAILSTGIFKEKTEYLIIGDEVQSGSGVLDLKTMLDVADYEALRKYLTMMPRELLRDFFMKKIYPSVPWDWQDALYKNGSSMTDPVQIKDPIYGTYHYKKAFEDMVWAAFVDLFNEANLEYVNKEQMEPWAWEQKKTEAYYVSSSQEAINALEAEMSAYQDVALALDPQAKKIMEAYVLLPKIGDTGLEINRQNAVKELLKKKDYVTAQAVVDAFRYINDTEMGIALTHPIPYDITSADGGITVQAT